ncbi:tail protein X [Paenibacillus sp. E222]|uniref:tail protein X n=1 Tax=Paenibacillus sp. E222 TaxID=2748863 RepID=UPI0015C675AD|nr:tail protein X [Paenibacillus sp. E222]QLG39397.1 tail protein X [Paenibacillus sp. E222]
MTTYRTIQGDTWDGIAYKLTGSYDAMPALMYANLDHIQTVVFTAGVVLAVPELQAQESSTLPSWRTADE